MLCHRHLSASYAAEAAQQSLVGYFDAVHGLADSCCIRVVGGLRVEYTVEDRRWTMSESGKHYSSCTDVQIVDFSLANDWLS